MVKKSTSGSAISVMPTGSLVSCGNMTDKDIIHFVHMREYRRSEGSNILVEA